MSDTHTEKADAQRKDTMHTDTTTVSNETNESDKESENKLLQDINLNEILSYNISFEKLTLALSTIANAVQRHEEQFEKMKQPDDLEARLRDLEQAREYQNDMFQQLLARLDGVERKQSTLEENQERSGALLASIKAKDPIFRADFEELEKLVMNQGTKLTAAEQEIETLKNKDFGSVDSDALQRLEKRIQTVQDETDSLKTTVEKNERDIETLQNEMRLRVTQDAVSRMLEGLSPGDDAGSASGLAKLVLRVDGLEQQVNSCAKSTDIDELRDQSNQLEKELGTRIQALEKALKDVDTRSKQQMSSLSSKLEALERKLRDIRDSPLPLPMELTDSKLDDGDFSQHIQQLRRELHHALRGVNERADESEARLREQMDKSTQAVQRGLGEVAGRAEEIGDSLTSAWDEIAQLQAENDKKRAPLRTLMRGVAVVVGMSPDEVMLTDRDAADQAQKDILAKLESVAQRRANSRRTKMGTNNEDKMSSKDNSRPSTAPKQLIHENNDSHPTASEGNTVVSQYDSIPEENGTVSIEAVEDHRSSMFPESESVSSRPSSRGFLPIKSFRRDGIETSGDRALQQHSRPSSAGPVLKDTGLDSHLTATERRLVSTIPDLEAIRRLAREVEQLAAHKANNEDVRSVRGLVASVQDQLKSVAKQGITSTAPSAPVSPRSNVDDAQLSERLGLFEENAERMRRSIQRLKNDLGEIRSTLGRKADRDELNDLANNEDVECKADENDLFALARTVHGLVDTMSKRDTKRSNKLDSREQAAIAAKQLLPGYKCLVCDRPLEEYGNAPRKYVATGAMSQFEKDPGFSQTRFSRPVTPVDRPQSRGETYSDMRQSTSQRRPSSARTPSRVKSSKNRRSPNFDDRYQDPYAQARAAGGTHTIGALAPSGSSRSIRTAQGTTRGTMSSSVSSRFTQPNSLRQSDTYGSPTKRTGKRQNSPRTNETNQTHIDAHVPSSVELRPQEAMTENVPEQRVSLPPISSNGTATTPTDN